MRVAIIALSICVAICLFAAAFFGVLGAFVAIRQSQYLPAAMYSALSVACCGVLASLGRRS